MKRIFALLLALVMCLSLAACGGGDKGGAPSGSSTLPSSTDPGSLQTADQGGNNPSGKCDICMDFEGHDRKCDVCGNWMYEKGEAWTAEVPENVRVVLLDETNNYQVVEMIGDKVYSKDYYDKESYENEGDRLENFLTLSKGYERSYYNGAYDTQWTEKNFTMTYGDRYGLFAVEVLKWSGGDYLSQTVETLLEASDAGSETVAGRDCVIKEYESFGTSYRLWMWNNLPLKSAQKYTDSEEEYKVTFEIVEWDESITAFSSDMPE